MNELPGNALRSDKAETSRRPLVRKKRPDFVFSAPPKRQTKATTTKTKGEREEQGNRDKEREKGRTQKERKALITLAYERRGFLLG